MKHFVYYARLFAQLLHRDMYAFKSQVRSFAINYMMFCPTVYAINYGYLMPNSGMMSPTAQAGTIFFVGSVLQILISPSIGLSLGVFFDAQHSRLIQYQMTFAPFALIIFERIFFFSLITFVFVSPYFLIAKWLLGSYFVTAHTSWLMVLCMLYLGSLFFAAFTLFFVFYIERIQQFGNIFDRFMFPMLQLGGLRIPFSAFMEFSAVLGAFVAFNPMMHITEGLRKATLGGSGYMPYYISVPGVLVSTAICAVLALKYARKRLDAV